MDIICPVVGKNVVRSLLFLQFLKKEIILVFHRYFIFQSYPKDIYTNYLSSTISRAFREKPSGRQSWL